jgi:anti-sigma B factor antagonist
LSLSISSETKGEANVVSDTLEQAMAGGTLLVLDLSEVQFIDSTALGVLVGALQLSQSNGGDFRLVIGDPFLLKIFRITGFDGMFSIHPKLEDALSAH